MNNHNGNHHGIVFCGCADSREERSPLDGVQSKTTVIFCTIYVSTYLRKNSSESARVRTVKFLSECDNLERNTTVPSELSAHLTVPPHILAYLVSSRQQQRRRIHVTRGGPSAFTSSRFFQFSVLVLGTRIVVVVPFL
jgi:hypothetical protein